MILFAFLKRRPLISVCVPAYKSQDTIRETLLSALCQTVDDMEIVVSNDGGYPTPELESLAAHPKVRYFETERRLGWVKNSNFALSNARGKFFMILPHDDVLRPQYVEECVNILERNRDVFAAYSDIEVDQGVVLASEVAGSVEERIIEVMRNRYNGFSYRAVMPRHPKNWRNLQLKPNRPSDFCVDTTWILQQACFGELRKVARPLYWKRINERNTHKAWTKLPQTDLIGAWQEHCRQMGDIAASRLDNTELVSELVSHRLDARRVSETPAYLKAAMF